MKTGGHFRTREGYMQMSKLDFSWAFVSPNYAEKISTYLPTGLAVTRPLWASNIMPC